MNTNKKRIKISILLAALLVVFLPVSRCFALSEELLDKFAGANIMFYNPEECSGTLSGGGLSGSNTKEKMWNFFRAKGLNEAQTAGVLGNAYVESGFVATRASNHSYWGLFQMNSTNAADMYRQLDDLGLSKYYEDISTYGGANGDSSIPKSDLDKLIQVQLDYAWDKWRTWDNWKEKIQAKPGDPYEPEYAAEVFVVHFEGAIQTSSTPGQPLQYYDHDGNWQGATNRVAQARAIYEEFKGSTVSNNAAFSSVYKDSNECCDPNAGLAGEIFQGTKYDLTDGQVAGITAMAVAENGTSEAGVKSEASLMANLFEYKKVSQKGSAEGLVNYLKTPPSSGGWFATYYKYSESYSGNSTYIEAVRDVLVNGNRTLPPQIVEHDCFTSACGAGIGSATNDGVEIDLNDKSQFKRGVTKLIQSGGGLSGSYIFWDWADPEKQTGDPFGYFASNPPEQGVLNGTKGSNSEVRAGSSTIWNNGWIVNGLAGYVRKEANSQTYADLPATFGQDFTTTHPNDDSINGPRKITFHTSNTTDGGGGNPLDLYEGNSKIPHFTVNLKTHHVYQHGSVGKTSSANGGGDNDAAGVQITLIGWKNDTDAVEGWNLQSASDFSSEDWMYLGELLAAINVETGISLKDGFIWTDITSETLEYIKNGIEAFNSSLNVVCEGGTSGDVKALQDLVLKVAWPDYSTEKRGIGSRKPEYASLIDGGVWYAGGCSGNDCGGFVTTMMRESGWDPEYNPNQRGTWGDGTNGQNAYLDNSPNWKEVTSEINSNADAKPGDVLISVGHTLLFVGEIAGFNNVMASASFATRDGEAYCPGTRPPMADWSTDIVSGYLRGGEYRVFRKVK